MNFPRGLSQFLFLSAVLITLTTSAWGALGDNAPPVPATFKTAHPRLPYPDTGFLSSLAGNAAALADYNSTAGGQIGSGFSNDLFSYDVASNTWTKVNPSGTLPSPRWRSGFAYDSTNDTILLYGGQDAAQVYNDTWVYSAAAGSWTKLTPGQAPPFDSVGPFENLAYDSDHNVFILVLRGTGGYADGGAVGHAMQTWMYRYQDAGSNAGTVEVSYQPAAGSVNVNSNAWAKDPALAVSGSALYSAWVETGKPFDTASASLFHVYAKQWNGTGAWTSLGGLPTSLDSEFNNQSESHSPSLTVVGGMPWISWYKWNNAGALWALWAKSWNGSSWQGGAVG